MQPGCYWYCAMLLVLPAGEFLQFGLATPHLASFGLSSDESLSPVIWPLYLASGFEAIVYLSCISLLIYLDTSPVVTF